MVRQDDRSESDTHAPDLHSVHDEPRAALPITTTQTSRFQTRRAILALILLAFLWWILNPGDALSWIIGIPTIVMGTAAVLLLPPSGTQHISVSGALRFVAYFVVQSVLGAIDVASRAFNPWRTPQPSFVTWETDLPDGAALWTFANTLTLLPGTLTAELNGRCLTVHLLDRDLDPDLSRLEARIRDLFALQPMETTQ